MKKQLITTAVAAIALGVPLAALPASSASAATGHRSLATVLAADGSGFDHNWNDFDILDNAVTAVLAAKPNSPVKVLADGNTRLTAFLPTDRAFRRLVTDLTGKRPHTERGTFKKLAATAGIDTIETVLLYHVVPGATITYGQARKADGASLKTAAGLTVGVNVRRHGHGRVALVDKDRNDANPVILRAGKNVNKGNLQIGHAINRVLRPINL